MRRVVLGVRLGLALGLLAAGESMAQDVLSSTLPAQPPGWRSRPSGTGATPAIAEARGDLPGYTVYRPRDWPPARRLPILVWGNGACRDNGLQHAQFLREIASHGIYVIALGTARRERPVAPGAASPAPGAPPAPPPSTVDETQVAQMIGAMDWAGHAPSDVAPHLDPARIAVAGHSCGGLQAIAASADPRVRTTLIFDSGVYNRPVASNRSNVRVTKADLARLHASIAYFIGGPTDIAYANAMDDVARIRVPVFLGMLPVGHGGTFWADENGGAWAQAASRWLAWQVGGDAGAARDFVGPGCELCRAAGWTVDNRRLGRQR